MARQLSLPPLIDPRRLLRNLTPVELTSKATLQILEWLTPQGQIVHLNRNNNFKGWERFRDGLVRRWTNLNIVCGLIMGSISTILFSNLPLTSISFAFGVVSLLSSLISVGFGVGLMYVLGDVTGPTLNAIGKRYPNLFLFALSIPQVWAGITFFAFFITTSLLGWEASGKTWIVKAGIILTLGLLAGHLVGFALLFRSQDTVEYLIPEREHGLTQHEALEKPNIPPEFWQAANNNYNKNAQQIGLSEDQSHSSSSLSSPISVNREQL